MKIILENEEFELENEEFESIFNEAKNDLDKLIDKCEKNKNSKKEFYYYLLALSDLTNRLSEIAIESEGKEKFINIINAKKNYLN